MGILVPPEDTSPPKDEDTLFQFGVAGTPYWALSSDEDSYNSVYAEGYRHAAQVLVKHVTTHPDDRATLIYPIVFLYRHQIELVLKNIIRRCCFILGRTSSKGFLHHRIDRLWQQLKPLVKEVNATHGRINFSASVEESIDIYIKQFATVDEGALNFRYPYSQNGQEALSKYFYSFNLQHFAKLIDSCLCHIDSIDDETTRLADTKQALESALPL